jgi:Flp pilus assembly protein TadB
VTDAPKPMSEDIRYRQRRYLISMGVRTGCFVTAVVSAMVGAPLWLVGLLVVGALLLPYLSVIYANGGREPQPQAKFTEPDEGDGSHHKGISGQRPEIGS